MSGWTFAIGLATAFTIGVIAPFFAERLRQRSARLDGTERDQANLVRVFEAAAVANQAHWWAFSALVRDWREQEDPRGEWVRAHRQEFHDSRRDLMAAISVVEIHVGRLAKPREGRSPHPSTLLEQLALRGWGGKLERLGELRVFSEKLTLFLRPYIESDSTDIPKYSKKVRSKYLRLREEQKDISDDYLAGALAADTLIEERIFMERKKIGVPVGKFDELFPTG